MFQPAYATDLISTLRTFGATVRYSIHGHTHMTEFRVLADAAASPLVGSQGIPAVSPIFGNNPAFFVLALDPASRAITDYSVYTLTNLSTAGATVPGVWSREYGFRETYGVDGLSATALAEVQHRHDATPAATHARCSAVDTTVMRDSD